MSAREVLRTTPMFIVVREFDEKRHADPACRGAYVRLLPGRIPEIVVDGLAGMRTQRDGEQRCERELQDQLYTAQVQANRDLHHEDLRREIVRATQNYVVVRVEDVDLHAQLTKDPLRRGGYLIQKPGKLPEILIDGLATSRDQAEAEERSLQTLSAKQSVDRLESLVRSHHSQHPQLLPSPDRARGGPPLGQRLVAAGLVKQGQVEQALQRQRRLPAATAAASTGAARRIGSLLVESGALGMVTLARALGQQRGVAAVGNPTTHVDLPLRATFPLLTMQEAQAAPLFVLGGTLTVAMADPHDDQVVALLQAQTRLQVRPLQASQLQVLRLIQSTRR